MFREITHKKRVLSSAIILENKNGIIHFSPNVIMYPNYFNMFQKRYQDKIFIFKKILRNVGSRAASGMSLYRSTNM
ncbi:hypothetical protein MCM1_3591 [Methanosarcina barkeri CM1]|uniref:Uncharacterized protein n=1 Tax=Methanosarcina barkeri CM1 TaxID=796385 RepID=A0A0G3CEW8_METBA|nr:hypothetical protein MCM1_3591 [Methanosarcina barkeri CM1]